MLGDLALDRVINVQAVVVEGRQGPHGADHNGHGVRVAAEAFKEAVELRVQHRVIGDVVFERIKLTLVRQMAFQQQIGHFEEVGPLCQLVDWIAAVQQHAFIAIDERDLAFARSS